MHFDVPYGSIIGLLLSAAFGAWAWVVKKFGEQHISNLKDLATELKHMRQEMAKLSERVQAVEIKQEYYHHHPYPNDSKGTQ